MGELLLNERDTGKGRLVSLCDPELIGETFENGELSLTVNADFYEGEPADEEVIVDSLAKCSVANIVGTEAVDLAIEHGFIEEENVLDIDGTRHAQLLWM
ncbi:MAG: hypothetical protein ACI8TL_000604 [Natronomonas sp.]|jgi:hypothetical protein